MQLNTQHIQEIKQLLSHKKEIVIIPHKNPDGDAMGASLAMYHYLINMGHSCHIIAPNRYPDFLKWLPQSYKVIIAEQQNVDTFFHNAELIFCLDFNTLSRIGDLQPMVKKSNAVKIMIDHHQHPDDFDYVYSDTTICATAQMVYHFIGLLGDIEKINKDIATCIYTGIMTDTGSFKFNTVTATTHRVVAYLLDKGAENHQIHSSVYDQNSLERLKLLSHAIGNLKQIDNLPVAYISLSKEELLKYNFKKGDTEGFVNYILSIKGMKMAAFFSEDLEQDMIKISFRSVGNLSVNDFAKSYFEGGGHINAAGGRSKLYLQQTIQKFEKLIQEKKDELF